MAGLLWFHYDTASHGRGRAGTQAEGLCRHLCRSHTPQRLSPTSGPPARRGSPGPASAGSPAQPRTPSGGKGWGAPGAPVSWHKSLWGVGQESIREAPRVSGLPGEGAHACWGGCPAGNWMKVRAGPGCVLSLSRQHLPGGPELWGLCGGEALQGHPRGQTPAGPVAHRMAFVLGAVGRSPAGRVPLVGRPPVLCVSLLHPPHPNPGYECVTRQTRRGFAGRVLGAGGSASKEVPNV